MWTTSLDISDAYHHIPIEEGSQLFLCFQIGNPRSRYLFLPFGLATAPRVFTDVVKQIKVWSSAHLRMLFQYLDDWLSLFRRRSRAELQTEELVTVCTNFGLLLNHGKSELIPKLDFLGETLDHRSLTAFSRSTVSCMCTHSVGFWSICPSFFQSRIPSGFTYSNVPNHSTGSPTSATTSDSNNQSSAPGPRYAHMDSSQRPVGELATGVAPP